MTVNNEAKIYLEALVLSSDYSNVVSILQGDDQDAIKEFLKDGTIDGQYLNNVPTSPGKTILYYDENELDKYSTLAMDICVSVFVTGNYYSLSPVAYDGYQNALLENGYGNQGFGLPEQVRKHLWENDVFIDHATFAAARLANQRIEVWSGESSVERIKNEIEAAVDKTKSVYDVITNLSNLFLDPTNIFSYDLEQVILDYKSKGAQIARSQLETIIRDQVPSIVDTAKSQISLNVQQYANQNSASISVNLYSDIENLNLSIANLINQNVSDYIDLFPGEQPIQEIVTASIYNILDAGYEGIIEDYANDVVEIYGRYDSGSLTYDEYSQELSNKSGFYLLQIAEKVEEKIIEVIDQYENLGIDELVDVIFRSDLAAILSSSFLDYDAIIEEERLVAEEILATTLYDSNKDSPVDSVGEGSGVIGAVVGFFTDPVVDAVDGLIDVGQFLADPFYTDSQEAQYTSFSSAADRLAEALGTSRGNRSSRDPESGRYMKRVDNFVYAAFGDEDIETKRFDAFMRAFSSVNTEELNQLENDGVDIMYAKLISSGLLELASYAYDISQFAQRRLTSINALESTAESFLDPSEDISWLQSLSVAVAKIKQDPIAFTTVSYYIPSLTTLLVDAIAITKEYGDQANAEASYIDSLEKAFGIGENGQQVFELAHKLDNTARRIKNVLDSSPYRSNIQPESPDIFHLRLGAANFYVPPISIDVNTSFKTGSLTGGAIRQKNTPKFNSGHKETSIRLRLFFPNYQEIWGISLDSGTSISLNEDMKIDFKAGGSDEKVIDKFLSSLRGLVAAFKYSPILPIKNHYLNSVHGISAVCLNSMSINTVPGYPFTLAVDLELLNFNHKPFLPMLNDFNQSIHWGKYRQYMGKAATHLHKYVNENFLIKTSDSKDQNQSAAPEGFDVTLIGTPIDTTDIPPFVAAPVDSSISQSQPENNFDVLSTNIVKEWNDGRHISFYVPAETQTKIFLPSIASFRSQQEELLTDAGESVWRRLLKKFGLDITEAADYGLSLSETIDISRNNAYSVSYRDLILDSIDIITAPLGSSDSAELNFSHMIESFIVENSRRLESLAGNREDWLREYVSDSGVIDLTQYQDPGPWYFQRKILTDSNGDNMTLERCKELIYRISLNPSSFLQYLTDQKISEITDSTGVAPDEQAVKEQMTSAFNAVLYERFFQSGPIQAYLEAQRARSGSYQFNEWEVPMIEVAFDENSVIVDSVNISMSNNFAKLQVQLMDEPTYQHIGGGDSFISISMTVIGNGNDELELKKLKRMFDHLSGLARLEHSTGVLGFMGIKNIITALAGVKYVLPMSFNVSTVPNQPHVYRVDLTLSDFDIFQQKRESLSSSQQKEMIEHFSSKRNPFLRIKQLWGSFNAYPDFPLSVQNSEGEVVGNLDPDFYFRSFETYDQDIINNMSQQKEYLKDTPITTPTSGDIINNEIELAKIEFDFIQYARRFSSTSSNESLYEEIREYVKGLDITREQLLYVLNEKVALKQTEGLSNDNKGQFISEFINFADDVSEDSIFVDPAASSYRIGDHILSGEKVSQQIQAALSGEFSLKNENYVSFSPDEVEFHKIIVSIPTGNREEIESGMTPSMLMTAIGNYYGYVDSKNGRFYLTNGQGGDLVQKADASSGSSSGLLLNPNYLEDLQTPDTGNTNVNSGVPGAKAISDYQNAYDTDVYTHWEGMLKDTQYRDNTGRMIRAFPTYMLWLIDEGGNFAGMKLFDNFYGLQSIIDFSIVSSEDIMADTLMFRLSNLYSKLTTNTAEEMFNSYLDGNDETLPLNAGVEMSIDRVLNLSRNVTGHMRNDYVVDINNIRLKPGVRVHLRAGYGSNPNSLQTLFNGVITEVEQGDIVTVTAQSDAVELSGMINSTNKKGDSGKIDGGLDTGFWMSEPRDLMVRLLSMGAGRVRENIARATRGTVFSENRFGIRHFGSMLYEPLTRQERDKQEAMYNSISSAFNGVASGRIGGNQIKDLSKTAATTGAVTTALSGSSPLATLGYVGFQGYSSYSSIKDATGLSVTGVVGALLGSSSNQPDLEVFKRNIYPGNGTGIAQFLGGDLDDGWGTVASLSPADNFNIAGSSSTAMLTDTAWNKLLIQTQKNDPSALSALDDLTQDYALNSSGKDDIVSGFLTAGLAGVGVAAVGAASVATGGLATAGLYAAGGGMLGTSLTGVLTGRGGKNLFRTMGLISPNEDDDLPGADEVSFRAQTYMRTVWDMFDTCARLLPNYIVAVRPFEDRSTIFYGKPHWLYTSGVVPVTTGYPGDEKARELGILDKIPKIKSPNYEIGEILTQINKSTNRYSDYSAFLDAAELSDSYKKIGEDIENSTGVYRPTSYFNGKILNFNIQSAIQYLNPENGEVLSRLPVSRGTVQVGYHLPIDPNEQDTIVDFDRMASQHAQITNLPPRYSFPYFVDTIGISGVSELKNNSSITIDSDDSKLFEILKDAEKDFFKDNEQFSLFDKTHDPGGFFENLFDDVIGGTFSGVTGAFDWTLDKATDVVSGGFSGLTLDWLLGDVPIIGGVTGALNTGIDWAETAIDSIGTGIDWTGEVLDRGADIIGEGLQRTWDRKWDYSEGFKELVVLDKYIDFSSAMLSAQRKLMEDKVQIPVYTAMPIPTTQVDFTDAADYNPDSIDFTNLRLFNSYAKDWPAVKDTLSEQFYIAMKWPYIPSSDQQAIEAFKNKYFSDSDLYGTAKDYRNRKVLVFNPSTGRAVVCAPAYFLWGENENDAVVSPDAAYYLGIITESESEGIGGFRDSPQPQDCLMAFVPDDAPLGVIAPQNTPVLSFSEVKANGQVVSDQPLVGFGAFEALSGDALLAQANPAGYSQVGGATVFTGVLNNSLESYTPYNTAVSPSYKRVLYGGNPIIDGESYFNIVIDSSNIDKLYDIDQSTDEENRSTLSAVYDQSDVVSIQARSFYDETFDPAVSVIAGNGRSKEDAQAIWNQFRAGYHTYDSVKKIFQDVYGMNPDSEDELPQYLKRAINPNFDTPIVSNFGSDDGTAIDEFALLLGQDYINNLEGRPGTTNLQTASQELNDAIEFARANFIDAPSDDGGLIASINNLVNSKLAAIREIFLSNSAIKTLIQVEYEKNLSQFVEDNPDLNVTGVDADGNSSLADPANASRFTNVTQSVDDDAIQKLIDKITTPKQLFLFMVGSFRQKMWEDPYSRAWLVLKPDYKSFTSRFGDNWSFKPVDAIFRAYISPYGDYAKASNKDKFLGLLSATASEGNSATNPISWAWSEGTQAIEGLWNNTVGPIFSAVADSLGMLLNQFKLSMGQLGYAVSESSAFRRQSNILNKALNDSIYYSLGTEGSMLRKVDNPFTREYGEPVVEIREPFQRIHYINSFSHILSNQIQETINDVATVITAVSDGKYPVTVALDKGAPSERQVEKTIETGIFFDNAIGEGALAILHPLMHPLQTIRGFSKAAMGVPDEISAKRIGLSHLRDSVKDIYGGELMVIGNADIRPHDLVYLADVYERMYGIFEVEQVVHHFTPDLGYITSITPNALVTINDPVRWSLISSMASLMSKQVLRNDTRIMLDQLRSANTGISVGGNVSMDALAEMLSPQLVGGIQYTHGSSALVKDLMSLEVAKKAPDTSRAIQDLMGPQGSKADLFALMASAVAGTAIGTAGAVLAPVTGGVSIAVGATIGGIASKMAWSGWSYIRDNLLDQHGCYVQYLNKNGQPMDAGLSYNQGMVVGSYHSKAILPGIFGTRVKMRTPEGNAYIRTDDLFKSMGWQETQIDDFVRYASYQNAMIHSEVLKLAGLGPEKAGLEPSFKVIAKCIEVKDGDTIKVQDIISGNQFNVRFDGINTSEINVIDGRIQIPDSSESATLSITDLSSSAGQATLFVQRALKDKLLILRINETRSSGSSSSSAILNEDYEAGNSQNNPINYQADKFDRIIGTIFYRVPDENIDSHKSYVNSLMRLHINEPGYIEIVKNKIKSDLDDASPFRLFFDRIFESLKQADVPNYYTIEIDSGDSIAGFGQDDQSSYSALVRLKSLEEIYSLVSRWPYVSWDDYYDDGTPFSLNWELVVNNLAQVYVKDLQNESEAVLTSSETVPTLTRVGN